MKQIASIAIYALLVCPAAGSHAKDSYIYGPAPDWETYKRIAGDAVLAKLPDPTRWRIDWPNAYRKAGWGGFGRNKGYMTCGVLRAVGDVTDGQYAINFAVVVDHGAVKHVHIAKRLNDTPNVFCAALRKRGMLPPASSMAASPEMSLPSIGLAIRVMPDGAYVVSIDQNSAAHRAALTPGMVITHVNAVPLAGLDRAMGRLLEADVASLALKLASGETLVINRQQ